MGSGGFDPRSRRQLLISSYDGGHAPMSPAPPGYATDGRFTNSPSKSPFKSNNRAMIQWLYIFYSMHYLPYT